MKFHKTESNLYVPSQVPLLQTGLSPLQGFMAPHLHSPEVQVFEVPVQSELTTHSIKKKVN